MTHKEEWVVMVIIARRKHKSELVKMLYDHEAAMVHQTYAKGTAKASFLKSLGFTLEQNKLFLLGFVKTNQVPAIFSVLEHKYQFKQPNSGFAFTFPLEKISY
ncbi:MAG: hypothetical protein BWY30_00167 [Tenericutes bacterium ADurb.Bin239]|nr:MAG: hypothetical protein BWY30_00167 [Tenericutes bacterium ADurb.Bin239]